MEGIASLTPLPSVTKRGTRKSSGVKVVSRTNLRMASEPRSLRFLLSGYISLGFKDFKNGITQNYTLCPLFWIFEQLDQFFFLTSRFRSMVVAPLHMGGKAHQDALDPSIGP